MHLQVADKICITEFRSTDRSTCVTLINDPYIFDNTLRIPSPYTSSDFDSWLAIVEHNTDPDGRPVNFVIREDESLIGSIGFDKLVINDSAEIGYWLGEPWRGRGVMTKVVHAACELAFSQWQLSRIFAHVFDGNIASDRVLLKNGFRHEGPLATPPTKDGRTIACQMFDLTRPTHAGN